MMRIEDLLPTFDESGHHVRAVTPWPSRHEEQLTQAETRAQIRACIDALPDPYRAVIGVASDRHLCAIAARGAHYRQYRFWRRGNIQHDVAGDRDSGIDLEQLVRAAGFRKLFQYRTRHERCHGCPVDF